MGIFHRHHKSKVEDYGNYEYRSLDHKIKNDHQSNIVGYLCPKQDTSPQPPLLQVMLTNQRILSSVRAPIISSFGTPEIMPDARMIEQLFNQLQDPVLATGSANRIIEIIHQFKNALANMGCVNEWRAMVNSAQVEPLLQQNPNVVKNGNFNFFQPIPVEELTTREMFRRSFGPFAP